MIDITLLEYMQLDDRSEFDVLAELSSPAESNCFGMNIDFMDDKFTYRMSIWMRYSLMQKDYNSQIKLLCDIFRKKPLFFFNYSFIKYNHSIKNMCNILHSIVDFEQKMLNFEDSNNIELEASGIDRLNQFGYYNHLDALALRYSIDPNVIMEWSYTTVITALRYNSVSRQIEDRYRNMLINKSTQ